MRRSGLHGPESHGLFDGATLDGWRMAGQGEFVVADGVLLAVPDSDIGLLWHTTPTPPDFILRCEWRRSRDDDNSGVYVRFPDPDGKGYDNPAYVGVDLGFEVQIDEHAVPDGADQHRTGAIYAEQDQDYHRQPALPLGRWNTYEIRVQGQAYTVHLNGRQVTRFDNPHPDRGVPSRPDRPAFIGLQAHTGGVAFRNVELVAL